MENYESEIEAIKESAKISRIVADMAEKQDRSNKRLMIVCLVQSVIIALLVGAIMFISFNGQKALDEAMFKALSTAGSVTTTTETTQTVEGDSATINNIDGEQYNDSAQKVGAK